jgi:glyoxylase-like metal-dependent hydrolase (beta-lactamase superfamily II)
MRITDEVTMLDCSSVVRIYLIKAQENVLIDTGLPGYDTRILNELDKLGAGKIDHIILTHCDIDHIGSARSLQLKTGAAIWASEGDIPFILNQKRHPGFKGMSQIFFPAGIPSSVKPFPAEMKLGDIQVIKAPGHTPGHVILVCRDILFASDLFAARQGHFRLPPRILNWNQDMLRQSLHAVKTLDFDWICPAHGFPEKRSQNFERFISQF